MHDSSTGDAFAYSAFPQSDELDRQVAAQREFLNRVLSSTVDDPRPGDVWVSTYRHSLDVVEDRGIPWLLLVLDSYEREYTANWVVDAVPVTEDAQVAADWSLAVSEERNDFDMTIVAHLDFQFTTNRDALQRRLGRLSEVCFECVRVVLRAFEVGESAPQCLACGTLGSASIRSRADWLELDAKLHRLIDDAMVSFDEETEFDAADASVPAFGDAESGQLTGMPARYEYFGQTSSLINRISARRELPTTCFNLDRGTETFDARGPLTFPSWPDAESSKASQARTFREALHLLLDSRYNGDVHVWAACMNLNISWGDLDPVLEHPIAELRDLPAMYRIPQLQKLVGRTENTNAVFRLVNEALEFLNGLLAANETLSQRAARRQDPFGTQLE